MRSFSLALAAAFAVAPAFAATNAINPPSRPQQKLKLAAPSAEPRYPETFCVDIGTGVMECWDCEVGPNAMLCGAPYISSVYPKGFD